MDRRDSILKYVTKEQRGIEIGPWFNPIAPKREGYQCLSLDVFDSDTLRQRATDDPNISVEAAAMIEDVDLVGSSGSIAELVRARGEAGTFDYIVSSHNFEHLPNPIRFLQGCATALKPGGVLSMAIPDHRTCFDYFRPLTRLSDWIQAFVEDRTRPSRAQDFDSRELFARFDDGNVQGFAFFRNCDPEKIFSSLGLDIVFRDWMERNQNDDDNYYDAHCSVFTPSSFELLIRDAAYLGQAPFEILEVFDAGCEFHAHLRINHHSAILRPADYEMTRNGLLIRIADEGAETSTRYQKMRIALERHAPADEPAAPTAISDEVAERLRQLEDTIDDLRASTSWKITGPLRSLSSRLRRIGNRHSLP